MPTQRYKLILAYRGTHYHGWQKQPWIETYKCPRPENESAGLPTIQETLAHAIGSVVNHPVTVVGSSRTDAAVHAKGQVAHFDTDQIQIPPDGLRRAVNARLPDDILIHSIEAVPDTFDAISSTLCKRYQYFIWNTEERPNFFPDLVWHRWQKLDRAAMRDAAKHFIGTHDFASFAKPGHGRLNTIRTIHACDVTWRNGKIVIAVEGSGFLWNMVRIMVGTLVEVGLGRHSPDAISQMLAAKDRQAAGSTAPPHGLYLQWIKTTDTPVPRPIPAASEHPTFTGLRIRSYRQPDLPRLLAVAKALPESFNEDALRKLDLDLRFQRGYVATQGPRIVGFISAFIDSGIATLTSLAVLPELHHQGIGRRLVDTLLAELKRIGVPEVRVYLPLSFSASQPFFHALRFEDCSPSTLFRKL
ncbi:MAG: tRNA pseudouridine(38-40) synthase TruA [Bacillota bacterium]